jgi:RNA polymerase sigma factor (sigma-70 family)
MIATRCEMGDRELVAAVRDGDDSAFEELYRRYHVRIAGYVRRMVHDPARAEDLAQDAFFSALRRMRATDADIAFKPWIFEIARNAAIDHWRRASRAEEVSVEADEGLRPSDRSRLVGSGSPDSTLAAKEQLEHLRGAFDELSEVHSRVLVMRELEGLSYREIAERLDLSRSSVESALFRARRRLETEYADISEGRRCESMRTVIARLAEGVKSARDEGRLARHARRCHVCRRRARELGVEPLAPLAGLRRTLAALLPLPLLARRGGAGRDGLVSGGAASGGQGAGGLAGLLPAGAQVGAAVAERAAALVAAAAIAGAGGAALGGSDVLGGGGDREPRPAAEQRDAPAKRSARDEELRRAGGAGGIAPRGRRAGAPARPGIRDGGHSPAGGGSPERTGSGSPERTGGGAGGLELPSLPAVPGVQGGGPAAPSGGDPQLPAPPDPPAVSIPAPPFAPRLEPPRAAPLELPTAPELDAPAAPPVPAPPPDPGAQLDGVTGGLGAG